MMNTDPKGYGAASQNRRLSELKDEVERLKRENAILRASVRLAAGLLADPQRAEINALLDGAEHDDAWAST